MISHQHQPSSQAAFPPYPYAHLYPQQPKASTSRPNIRAPHSHHGHGSPSQVTSADLAAQARLRATSPPPVLSGQSRKWQQAGPGPTQDPTQPPSQGHVATKANLKAWWSHFNFVRAMKKDPQANNAGAAEFGAYKDASAPTGVVFGRPLKESLKYANVQISTADSNGELYVWGYIPVVVAKCGLYLKENATEIPGTFRVNGSSKRMRTLQETFETPPRYGKNLDWKQEQFTTHDVASVFRRYLTQMPEPVIPYDLYHQFRDALVKEPIHQEEVISKYKALIRQMPRANQYLLLYVLDLLSVFARKSDVNLMTATNLAVIFRPGIISHPNHEMAPQEHALSQRVLEFLIAHQDWFMLEIPPPPARRGSAAQSQQPQQLQMQQQSPQLSNPAPQRRGIGLSDPGHISVSAPTSSALHSPTVQFSPQQPPTPPTAATLGHGSPLQQQQQGLHNVSRSGYSNGYGYASGSLSAGHNDPYRGFGGGGTSPTSPATTGRPQMSRFGSSSGRAFSEVGSDVDDVMVIPGALEEVEEFSSGSGGGWRLVLKGSKEKEKEKEKDRIKTMRRRTTMERSDLQNNPMNDDDVHSPVVEPITNNNGGVTVQRSRTLPTSRRKDSGHSNSGATSTGELVLSSSAGTAGKENVGALVGLPPLKEGKERRGMLLKKNRRISSNPIDKEKDRTL